ncbi:MAG: ribonuclease H-like domain-containing protein [Candidatus Loosdrechtia sp.]|uniref:ribonuclease H-like domain-containing protein n=1 Tax=Candidatus Loosdrechtia sp. TaxID=3101272 RepID=UPI003A673B4C|nr:MAG: ribonuclease H-like domain-containing protein [Candidatus Jettenia sp. AMX2]
MLSCTFLHLKGISPKKEEAIWRSGIASWDDFESSQPKQFPLFKSMGEQMGSLLCASKKALEKEDVCFFSRFLPNREHYRIALAFPEKTLFLDIETTGLSKYYNTITVVGWSLCNEYGVFIKGNSDKALRSSILKAKIIITFNGSLFDLPFLRKEFPDLPVPLCHIDLRFFAKRAGLSGGQKEIEKLLEIKRPKNISHVEGKTAVFLWNKYCCGDISALKQLIAYNHADIEGMKIIFDRVVESLLAKKQFPLPAHTLHRFTGNKSKIEWAGPKPGISGGWEL